MFHPAVAGQPRPTDLSTDHDPIFHPPRYRAHLRVLVVDEIKSDRYAPMSHTLIERLIGTIRR